MKNHTTTKIAGRVGGFPFNQGQLRMALSAIAA